MSDPVEAFLSNYPEEIQTICRELRFMASRAMPGAYEFLFYNAIDYALSESPNRRICYISPSDKRVTLGFRFGAELQDQHHLLRGKTKRARHVNFISAEDARNPALEELLRAAWVAGPASVARMKQERSRLRQRREKQLKRRVKVIRHRTRRKPRLRRTAR